MKSKIFIGILTMAMVINLFTGCSNMKNDSNEVNNKETTVKISTVEDLHKFKEEMIKLDSVGFRDEDDFINVLKDIFEKIKVIYEGEEISFDDFMELSYFDNTSYFYRADIDNDGDEDLIFTYKFAGTGMFSSIDKIFLKNESTYEYTMYEDAEEMVTNFLDVVFYRGNNYIYTTASNLDKIYKWEGGSFKVVFDEYVLVDNSHLDADYTELDNLIYEKYDIGGIEGELLSKGIDFSLSTGRSNKEILTTFYKMQDFIEADKREDLANIINFPIVLSKGESEIKIYSKKQFLQHYDEIINNNIKKIVLNSTPEDIFASWRGAMLGSGEIVFTNYIFYLGSN